MENLIRVIYQAKLNNPSQMEVVSAYPNQSDVITRTLQRSIVADKDEIPVMLGNKGIDFSYLWKSHGVVNGSELEGNIGTEPIINRIDPKGPLFDIDPCPLDETYTRKVFVFGFNVQQNEKGFWFNLIVRHYKDGVYTIDPYDDIWVPTWVDNTKTVPGTDDMGEYDFFIDMLKSNNSIGIEELQGLRIPVMQANGRFGIEIYE